MSKMFAFILLISVAVADKSPVLIWSSDIPLSDLPQSHIGQTVNTDQFGDGYLKPLTLKDNLVVFLQDKLTLEDFINHADVYNMDGDGGAFKNVKATLEEQYSVQLPAVSDPSQAIKSLVESFTGKVTQVDKPEDVESLSLDTGKKNLVIIKLPNILGNDEGKAFRRNDEMIGKCLHHLQKRDVKFSAIYTAASSVIVKEETFVQRHLLATADSNSTAKFMKTSQSMMYVKTINVTVIKMSQDVNKPDTSHVIPYLGKDLQVTGKNVTNQTLAEELTMTLSSSQAEVLMSMNINYTWHGEYESSNGKVTVNGKGNLSTLVVKDMPINFKIQATKGFSYHCTKLQATPILRGYNNSGNYKVYITFGGFQFEAFTNVTSERFSDNVWDCVEFFTTGIWMGILTTLVLVMILFFGVTMIASITTMDRFDDPKGKTITVTVNE